MKETTKLNGDCMNTLTDEQLFMQSAWLLYENRERILSDPRMVYAPINMHNGVIWVGDGAFEAATVGVYLNWWQECPQAVVTDEKGQQHLIVRFVGSALSGGNKCTIVAKDGTIAETHVKNFRGLWLPFWKLCHRYADGEQPEQPFCLEEVVCWLKGETEECMKFIHERLKKWR